MPRKKKTTKEEKTAKLAEVTPRESVEISSWQPSSKEPESKENRLYHFAVGRRKTSHASVKLFPNGKGEFKINGKELTEYFSEPFYASQVLAPFATVGKEKEFDVSVRVLGGGKHSQVEAIRHGIARALVGSDEDLRTTLKKLGFLTRDSRAKERKKYGLKRARKGPQFSKR
jgi:small subunit ribosomal protein S9